MIARRTLTLGLVALAASLLAPAGAFAHAVLETTRPAAGAAVATPPDEVSLHFDEPVEATFGALRVFDPRGEPLATGELEHSDPETIGVSLPDVGDGIYTVTYRVVSADSHPVAGGFTFTVGESSGAPAVGVGELVEQAGSGPVTDAAFGVARVATYAATALLIGGVAFLVFAFAPALAVVPDDRRERAGRAFDRRLRRLLALGVALGIIASLAGIALQAATALGGSFWDALSPSVIADELGTRFGTVWGLRALDFALLGALLLVPAMRSRASSAPATLAVGLGLGFLALAPVLGGHLGVTKPGALALLSGFVHVLAGSLWLGGLAPALFALPGATGELAERDRTLLLAACFGRFSTLALAAVAALLATGVVQSILQLGALAELVDSGYGRAILIKAALLAVLIGFGVRNRGSLRRLDARLAAGESPGRAGVELRRAIRAEVVLLVGVLAATAFLAATAPPSGSQGPFSASAGLGPAQLEVTVDPARTGPNQIHLYLFDADTGEQYVDAREVTLTAELPDAGITGLEQAVRPSGPGHYVVRGAELAVPGDWVLDVEVRVSAFDRYDAEIEVPVR